MADKGFILLHRKIWENVFFSSGERFDRRSAWIYLITHANHETRSFMVKGKIQYVQRGQLFTSVRYLAQVWGWDKDTVRKFLSDTETEKMTTVVRTQNGTLITILNFNKYNSFSNRTPKRTDTDPDTEPTSNPDTHPDAEPPLLNNVGKNVQKKSKKGAAGATAGGQVIE